MFPESFLRFVQLFNEGRFWESHEALEGPWRANGSDFYRGLIIYASAFVHAQRDNPHGVVAQLEKAEAYLTPYRPRYHGLDVDRLLAHGRRCRDSVRKWREAEAEPRAPEAGALADILAFPRLRPDGALVRGDEPEMA